MNHHQNIFKLTKRECECVFLLVRGKTAKEMADLLLLSKRIIESYIENIKNKMNCQNKAELLVKAVSNGYHKQVPIRLNHLAIMKSL
ncbi:response regulator transcription factor [Aquicella siphonis]|uniref:response regulator transcription factor n=1 Tax=Aquicella siphonis TaxID=254247 RepID=UPI001E4A3997|nr:helix-turn-helix transcriptional regulator [Aquicella siphonis]